LKRWWPIALVLVLASALYFRSLGTAPVSIGGDEARFATVAWSIATTGRDPAANRLPLFFHMSESLSGGDAGARWYQPLLFYLMALVFRVVPVGEGAMRIPTAVIGIADVFLIYCVARQLFGDRFWAAMTALMLAFSPAHFIFSRQALDYICPLPFVLGWLWCLLTALETGSVWLTLCAGLLLGAGFYSYIAAWVIMPLLLLLTWVAAFQSKQAAWRGALAATIGFALPVVAVAPWLWRHPEMWRDIVGRYKVYDARHLSLLQGAKDFLSYKTRRNGCRSTGITSTPRTCSFRVART
jgi:4-amino-4-deoxy-L-arabinose transferase-like glycosyltransferase